MSPNRVVSSSNQSQPQSLDDWRRFLDRAVHDLSAPLRGIGTSAGLLSEMYSDDLNPEARQLLQALIDGVGKMDVLLRAISDFSSSLDLDASAIGPVPVEGVVRSALATIEPLVTESRANVEYADLPSVNGNWEPLSMLFAGLFQNAIQYHGPAAPQIHLTAVRDGAHWRFAVKDNGCGIDAQYLDRIFLPFERLQTTRDSSAGLGLAISKRIVEAHGGRIWAESQPGGGSTFFFTLPASDDDPA